MFLSEVVPGIPAGASLAGAEEIPEELLVPEAVEHIGRDPVDPSFDVAKIRRIMLRTSSGIKRLLLDQSVVSGIGNIYADEALWRARIHYAKPAKISQRRPNPGAIRRRTPGTDRSAPCGRDQFRCALCERQRTIRLF